MSSRSQSVSRVLRTHQQAQASYDRISAWYDWLEGNWESKSKDRALQELGVQPGEFVLEIGFATGHALLSLARAVGETGKVFGIDLSRRMVDISRARVCKAGLAPRVDLLCGDAIQLPFRGDALDAILMSYVVELFDTPEIPRVLSECRRVLRDNGRLAVVSLSKAGDSNWMRLAYEWGHERFPSLLDCRPIFVEESLSGSDFLVRRVTRLSLWGLPVDLALAAKGQRPSADPVTIGGTVSGP